MHPAFDLSAGQVGYNGWASRELTSLPLQEAYFDDVLKRSAPVSRQVPYLAAIESLRLDYNYLTPFSPLSSSHSATYSPSLLISLERKVLHI